MVVFPWGSCCAGWLGRAASLILTTDIAEIALRIPAVCAVVDSGLIRQTVFRYGVGVNTIARITNEVAER